MTPHNANKVVIPANGWKPREYQRPLWNYLLNGGKRAVVVMPRRHGKDLLMLNWIAVSAFLRRVGSYWHCFPEYGQAKKAIFYERTNDGIAYLDAFPGFSSNSLTVESTNANDMLVRFTNGSSYRLVGANDPNNLVGANPVGLVFSEMAQIPVRSWTILQPIVEANAGWAVFISTPRGKNHFYKLYEFARSPEGQAQGWFAQHLTYADCTYTCPHTGQQRLVFTHDQIASLRQQGVDEEEIQQEYYCSWISPSKGAYYGKEFIAIDEEGRITDVPVDKAVPVNTAWDLGYDDYTAIWFYQLLPGGRVNVVDYYENREESIVHYIKVLREKGYEYGTHYAPWDVDQHSLQTGSSTLKIAASYGIKFKPAKRSMIDDGIETVRSVLPKCWFDERRCELGITRLREYRKRLNSITDQFGKPLHDAASHGADAFRTLAWGLNYEARALFTKISPFISTTKRKPLI